MSVKTMEHIKDKLCQLLEEFEKNGSITTAQLENIYKITSSIKNIDKIIMSEIFNNSYDDGRSYYANDMSGRRYRNGSSYNDGNSYRRGYSYADETMMVRDRMEAMMRDQGLSNSDKTILREAMNLLDK